MKHQRLAIGLGFVLLGLSALPGHAQQPFKPATLPRFATPLPEKKDPHPAPKQPDAPINNPRTVQPQQPAWQNQQQLPALSGGYVGGSPGASPLVRQLQTRPLQRYLEKFERDFAQPNFNTPFLPQPSGPTFPINNRWVVPQQPWNQPNLWNNNPWNGPLVNNWNNQFQPNPWAGPAFPFNQSPAWLNGLNVGQPPLAANGFGNPFANNFIPGFGVIR